MSAAHAVASINHCDEKHPTYNGNAGFMAPAPVVAYEGRRVTLNMIYFPEWREVNRTNQLGFWLTFRLRD